MANLIWDTQPEVNVAHKNQPDDKGSAAVMSRVENSAQFLSSRIVRTAPAPEIGISSIRRVKAARSMVRKIAAGEMFEHASARPPTGGAV